MSAEKERRPFLLNVFRKSLSIALLGITGGVLGGILGGALGALAASGKFLALPAFVNSAFGQFFGGFSGAITAASLAPGPGNNK